jgi:hypothetical protein
MKCSVCGSDHPLEQLELTFKWPDALAALNEAERESRCKESDDLAHIDHKRWFVRGTIPLPVAGRQREYRIGAWAEVEESAFRMILKLWSEESQDQQPPISARLANEIPGHVGSSGQPVLVKLVSPTARPDILVSDENSSLGLEQLDGISEHQAVQYSSYIYHGGDEY